MSQFVAERFPLLVHGPAIVLFYLASAAVARAAGQTGPLGFAPRDLIALFITALVFLRMRLYDEVKDYGHDLVHNPGRPLPRGLLSVRETGLWAHATAAIELVCAAVLGSGALAGYAVLFVFTVLMRVEFFAPGRLRRRLFSYAFVHTPSGGLIGLFVACAVLARPPWQLPAACYVQALAGWMLLMVFEVARKTFEPRPHGSVDTYSHVFGVVGAAGLNATFAALAGLSGYAAVALAMANPAPVAGVGLAVTTGTLLVVAAAYGALPSRRSASWLRSLGSADLVLITALQAAQVAFARGVALRGVG
jgi:4-hydroxybenzoate polyprenyltransferase